MNHDRNCASRWQASSECDCGADRVNSEEAIYTLESVNRALESRVAELEAAATCGCGDMFNANHQGTCPNCMVMLESRVAELEAKVAEAADALTPYLEEKIVGDKAIPNRALQVYRKLLNL